MAGETDAVQWDEFLDARGGRSFARFGWSQVLSNAYRARPHFLLAHDPAGTIRGIFAGYLNRDLRGRSMLFSVRHGLLATDDETYAALYDYCADYLDSGRAKGIAITSGLRRPPQNIPRNLRTTLILTLEASEETTWKSLRRETRAGITRSIKRGAKIEWGFHNLEAFYDIYAQNMLQLGAPLHNLQFFKEMAANLGDRVGLIVVRADGIIVAGMIVMWSSDALDLIFGAWLRKHARVVPYQRMYWEAIAEAQRRGTKIVDMGESREGSGTWTYKRNFGGHPETVHNIVQTGRRNSHYSSDRDTSLPDKSRPSVLQQLQGRLPPKVQRAILRLRASTGRII
jgi:hypothetical protein